MTRHGCSQLNADFARINLVPFSSCNCGHPREDALHYFIHCPNYNAIRESMRRTVTNVGTSFDIGTLLYGNRDLCYNDSVISFSSSIDEKKDERFA